MKKRFYTVRQAESFASKKIRSGSFNWLQAGAEDNFTRDKNIYDLQKIKIIPKLLNKINKVNITASLFGKKLISPLILSPMGHQTQFHYDGEIETCKAFNKTNRLAFFGNQGRISLEDIRKSNKNSIIGYNISPFGNTNYIKKEILKAEKLKCLSLCLCLDANVRSHRYQDRETGYDARKYGRRTNPIPPNKNQALNFDWSLINWVRKNSNLPIIVKGVITKDDFKESAKRKVDAIWISNHGGRMLNSGISSVDAIREVKDLKVNKLKIIIDGGIRKGTDILKYLCLGADLVGIGRPAIYGLIYSGHLGVKEIFDILDSELKTAMMNGGFKNLDSMKFNRLGI